jgi:hypothetical protein
MELILTKNGKIRSKDWNGKRGKYIYKNVTAGYAKGKHNSEDTPIDRILSKLNILSYLQYAVRLEDGFTLRSYFKLIENYPALQSLDYYFYEYVDEYKQTPKKNCIMDDVSCIEVSNVVDLSEGEGISDVQIWVNVSGKDKIIENERWALDFSSLADMLDIPIVLSGCYVTDYKDGEFKTREFKDYAFSFWEFLKSIIDEISFHGSPKDKNDVLEQLKRTMQDICDKKIELVPLFDDKKGE